MTTTAAAIYEHGVLRPLSPLPLAEGARVEVTVTDDPSSAQATENGQAGDLLRAVAALPMESGDAGFSGRDHDRILYGRPSGAL
jgi:predicted DNA-binding antitoxin AbrB/MazE fold protein